MVSHIKICNILLKKNKKTIEMLNLNELCQRNLQNNCPNHFPSGLIFHKMWPNSLFWRNFLVLIPFTWFWLLSEAHIYFRTFMYPQYLHIILVITFTVNVRFKYIHHVKLNLFILQVLRISRSSASPNSSAMLGLFVILYNFVGFVVMYYFQNS